MATTTVDSEPRPHGAPSPSPGTTAGPSRPTTPAPLRTTAERYGLDEASLAELGRDGPTADELDRAQAQLRRDYELSNAYQRAQAVIEGLDNPALGLTHFIAGRSSIVGRVDADEVRELAARALPADNHIEVIQVPIAAGDGE